ncbi:MAG: AAA domain-containing protein, partial [Coriobacteriales bacterium]
IQEEVRKIRRAIVEEEKSCVAKARIVGTTISKVYANSFFEERAYDAVMFDEVSMAFVPQVVCASMHARQHLVLVGDFRQLPPIVQSKDGRMLSRDIFWYLGICDEGQRAHFHPWLVMLDEQRRMHPQISAFPAKTFYSGLLRDHESVLTARDAVAAAEPFSGSAMSLVDLSGTYCTAGKNSDHSRFNILGAAVSFACALTAEAGGSCSVGVISPYKAQCRLVRAMVEDCRAKKRQTAIACSTVHQFQGSERDVVVIDAVESCPSQSLGVLTSNNENGAVDRLVNVAATRARGKLITVANGRFWELKAPETGCAFADLVSYNREFNEVASVRNGGLKELLGGLDFGPNIELFDEVGEAVDALDDDILRSSHRIVISIPDGKLEEPYAGKVLMALSSAKARGVEVLLKCLNWDELPGDWKRLGWQSEDAVCPMVLIDDRVVWHGMPPARGQLVDKKGKGFLAVFKTPLRITGKNTVEMIKSLTDAEGRVVDGQRTALQAQTSKGAIERGGRSAAGFARYVQENMKCQECRAPMKLERGYNSKKYFARCSACKATSLIDVNFLNHYICVKQARCPKCKGYLTARVSTYGLYIKCDNGHTVRPDEI